MSVITIIDLMQNASRFNVYSVSADDLDKFLSLNTIYSSGLKASFLKPVNKCFMVNYFIFYSQ